MDEADARELVAGMESAWNSGDHDAFAEFFSPDAVFVNVYGGYRAGREDIRSGHEHTIHVIYHDSQSEDQLELYRPLSPEQALVLVSGVMKRRASGEIIHRTRRTLVLDATGDRLQIVWFHNTILTKSSRGEPTNSDANYRPLS